jgi:hypothetical protein
MQPSPKISTLFNYIFKLIIFTDIALCSFILNSKWKRSKILNEKPKLLNEFSTGGILWRFNIAICFINTRLPLLRFRSALHCGYSGITDIQDGLFLSPCKNLLKKLGSGAR